MRKLGQLCLKSPFSPKPNSTVLAVKSQPVSNLPKTTPPDHLKVPVASPFALNPRNRKLVDVKHYRVFSCSVRCYALDQSSNFLNYFVSEAC